MAAERSALPIITVNDRQLLNPVHFPTGLVRPRTGGQ